MLWSDESKFNMIGNDGKGYVRRPINKRFDPKYTKGTVKFGGGNIMVWGCFSWYGLGPLRLVDGKMDRFQYQQILSETMLPYLKQLGDSHSNENLVKLIKFLSSFLLFVFFSFSNRIMIPNTRPRLLPNGCKIIASMLCSGRLNLQT